MRIKPSGIVTLITDFGLAGEYTGAMKGAILKVNPRCRVVDITHQVAAQDVLHAAFILKNTYPYYPAGTVHVVVVDPGVGTRRRPIILQKEGHFFVGPDNGVFSFVLSGEKEKGYEITRQEIFLSPLSPTFHGRDIFAPAAGHLSLGTAPGRLGPRVGGFKKIEWPRPWVRGKEGAARILFADAFGNLTTNISREEYETLIGNRPWRMKGRGWSIHRIEETYDDVRPGQALALFGSAGLLEIAVNRGNAQLALGLKPGDTISIDRL